jgi:hypothetical protein
MEPVDLVAVAVGGGPPSSLWVEARRRHRLLSTSSTVDAPAEL